jgi:hypothetical protein
MTIHIEKFLHTHIIASATSVTRNLLSTSHSCPTLPTMAAAHPSRPIPGLICNSSAKNVNAHRKPHHAAGRVLSARHTSSGMYHLRSTPKMTATRGCSGEDVVWPASLPSGVWDVSEVGDGGATTAGVDRDATSLRNWPCSEGTGGRRSSAGMGARARFRSGGLVAWAGGEYGGGEALRRGASL